MEAHQVEGLWAVKAAKITNALKLEERPSYAGSEQILYKEDKTFYLTEGTWVDSAFTQGAKVTTIKFGSDEYFRLLVDKPGCAKYLSVGRNMIIVLDGVSFRIIE